MTTTTTPIAPVAPVAPVATPIIPQYKSGISFQFEIIVAMVKDPKFATDHSDVLDPTYFNRNAHQTLAQLVLTHVLQHRSNPSLAGLSELVREHCKGRDLSDVFRTELETEVGLIQRHDIIDIGQLRDSVTKFGQTQALRKAVMEVIPLLENEDVGHYSDIRSKFDRALRVGAGSGSLGLQLGEHLPDLGRMAREDVLYNREAQCPTGFETIDSALRGGIAL